MRKLLVAGACVGLVGCTTPNADVILSLNENVQTEALRACHAAAGVEAPFSPQKITLDDGRVSVFVANENGLSLAEARGINRCKSDRLLATYGPGGDIFERSVEEQNAAILACKNARGVPGRFETAVFAYGSGTNEVVITPGGQVTEADARAINACARGRLRGAAPVAAQTAPAPAPATPAVVQNRPAPRGTCPRGASVLYGGSGYC